MQNKIADSAAHPTNVNYHTFWCGEDTQGAINSHLVYLCIWEYVGVLL